MTTLNISASFTRQGAPQSFAAESVELATRAEAEALAATFPKSVRMTAVEVTCHRAGKTGRYYLARMTASLISNGATGAVNEASQRRIRALLRSAERQGVTLAWVGDAYVNSYATREGFVQAAGL